MSWAEKLESQGEEAVQENPWESKIEQPIEEEEQNVEKPLYEDIIDGGKYVAEKHKEIRDKYGEISYEIARSTAAGLYKASGDMMALASSGIEVVYDTGRVIGREGHKLATGRKEGEMDDWKETNYLSKNFRETTNRDVEAIAGEDQGVIGEYTQKIAEYAGITQAVTRNFIKRGASLISDPKLVSSNVVKGAFDRAMMAAAKNPTAAIAMEQGVSALIASSGETAKKLGFSPTGQFMTELTMGLLSGQVINSTKSIVNFLGKKIPGSAERIGKIQAAEYIQEVKINDPKFIDKLEEGLKLQAETGIKMNLAQLTNNPELKAALIAMEVHTAGSITGFEVRLAEQTKMIKEAFKSQPELKDLAVRGVEEYRSTIESALDKQATKAVDNVLDQIDSAAPIDKETLGETGRAALNQAREAMDLEVNQLYKEVGNPNIPTASIVKAVNEARKSPLVSDSYMKELDAEIISTLEKNILGKTSQRAIEAPNRSIKLHGADRIPTEISLDGARLIESRLKERIRIANAAGKGNEARLLGGILAGVFEQYKNVPTATAFEIANLRKAAAASRRLHEVFDQGEVLLQSRIDVRGMEKITNEGFVRNFIKPNSDTKLARTNEAVDGFYNAYGNMPEARQWLANAFGSLLKEEIARHGDQIRPKAIKLFIDRHSSFLKKASIENRFDTVVKAIEEAKIADDAIKFDGKEFKKTVMSKFIGSDDPVNFVTNAAQSGKLAKLVTEIDRIPNKDKRELVQRGINEALWEGIKRKLTTTQTASGEEILLNTGAVRNMLDDINHGKELKIGLGQEHYNSLKQLINTVDRISPEVTSTAGLPKAHIDEHLVEKLMTGLRAAAHGFVRPDLIAAQMSMRGYKAITTKQAHRILKEAMENPEMAKELLNLSTTIVGKKIVGTMFSPLVAPVVSEKE